MLYFDKMRMGDCFMTSLIGPGNTWLLLSITCVTIAGAIWLEQKYAWASRISGAVICLLAAVLLVNLGVIPSHAPLFDDIIWGYAVPVAIPLLLLQANMARIWQQTGRMLFIFLIGAVGTLCGAVLGYEILGSHIPGLAKVAAMMTGSYIGGGVNFVALSDAFKTSGTLVSATVVADNLNMAVYFLVLLKCVGSAFFRTHYTHPHIDRVEQLGKGDAETLAAAYWSRKDISLKDIAMNLMYAVVVVTLSRNLGAFLGSVIPTDGGFAKMGNTFFSSQYVWITLFSMLFATFFEKEASRMSGAQEIGTYFIYMFFFAIGVPASIPEILHNAPLLFVFCFIMVVVNMAFCFLGGKLFHFNLEDIVLASNANIGGPTTAAGMAISQGWVQLVGPSMLVGTFGYVIGTYIGMVVGSLLGA